MVLTEPHQVVTPNREQRRAAGYTGSKRVYRLVFEDQDLAVSDGVPLVIRAKGVSFRKLLDIASMDQGLLGRPVHELGAEEIEVVVGLMEDFGGCIVEWNLVTDDGEPLVPSADTLLDQDPGWVLRVFMAWMQAIASVPTPLGGPSPAGAPSPGVSMPMATPSESPLS